MAAEEPPVPPSPSRPPPDPPGLAVILEIRLEVILMELDEDTYIAEAVPPVPPVPRYPVVAPHAPDMPDMLLLLNMELLMLNKTSPLDIELEERRKIDELTREMLID